MLKKSSVALIVPCYNESESIPAFGVELLDFINQFNSQLPEFILSVVLVNNNSTDNSVELLNKLKLKSDYISIENCQVQGYGAALKYGFNRCSADYICFLDLDNTYPLKSIFELLNILISQDLDIVYGARIHPESEISVIRFLGNRFYVLLLKYLFNSILTDVCSGMRIFKGQRKSEIIKLKSNDLSFSIDFTSYVHLKSWNISELPILYRTRTGQSKLSIIKDGLLFLVKIVNNYIRMKFSDV